MKAVNVKKEMSHLEYWYLHSYQYFQKVKTMSNQESFNDLLYQQYEAQLGVNTKPKELTSVLKGMLCFFFVIFLLFFHLLLGTLKCPKIWPANKYTP